LDGSSFARFGGDRGPFECWMEVEDLFGGPLRRGRERVSNTLKMTAEGGGPGPPGMPGRPPFGPPGMPGGPPGAPRAPPPAPPAPPQYGPEQTVTLQIAGITDNDTRQYILDKLRGMTDVGGVALVRSETRGEVTEVTVAPVRDVPAFAARIDFGEVTKTDGRV